MITRASSANSRCLAKPLKRSSSSFWPSACEIPYDGLLLLTSAGTKKHTIVVFAIIFWMCSGFATKFHEHRRVFEAVSLDQALLRVLQAAEPIIISSTEGQVAHAMQNLQKSICTVIVRHLFRAQCLAVLHLVLTRTMNRVEHNDGVDFIVDLAPTV